MPWEMHGRLEDLTVGTQAPSIVLGAVPRMLDRSVMTKAVETSAALLAIRETFAPTVAWVEWVDAADWYRGLKVLVVPTTADSKTLLVRPAAAQAQLGMKSAEHIGVPGGIGDRAVRVVFENAHALGFSVSNLKKERR